MRQRPSRALSRLVAGPGRALGRWLLVNDQLATADVIFVHQSTQPFPAVEAAALYAAGWAPEVWVAAVPEGLGAQTLRELGVRVPQGHQLEVAVLTAAGVPEYAIRILPCEGSDTRSELASLVVELRRRGLANPILVTVAIHSRRVRLLWNAAGGLGLEAIVRCARRDPFDLDAWWTDTKSADAVVHEVFGLLNARLGFPLRSAPSSRHVGPEAAPVAERGLTERNRVGAVTTSPNTPTAPPPAREPRRRRSSPPVDR